MGFSWTNGNERPAQAEAAKAVAECQRAGIKTVMITGDHKLTAQAIAKEAGIMKAGSIALTGDELDRMDDKQLDEVIENCRVFARVTPEHKLRIVKAFKSRGHVCAMTGDGVNDAPAIKEADIGVSMGISGTEVTKQAADVILLDDNFATLVNSVEEGRTIYQNIRKFVALPYFLQHRRGHNNARWNFNGASNGTASSTDTSCKPCYRQPSCNCAGA